MCLILRLSVLCVSASSPPLPQELYWKEADTDVPDNTDADDNVADNVADNDDADDNVVADNDADNDDDADEWGIVDDWYALWSVPDSVPDSGGISAQYCCIPWGQSRRMISTVFFTASMFDKLLKERTFCL